METEEGFNLAIRRMLRTSSTYYVLHVAYSAFSFLRNNLDLLQLLQNTTEDTVQPYGGVIYQMRKGDQFVVFNEHAGAKVSVMADNITAAAFPDRKPGEEDSDQVLARIYHVPQEYVALRRAASAYLDATGAPTAAAAPAPAIKTAPRVDLEGPLSAEMLAHIERELAETDLAPYIRGQGVFELDSNSQWQPLFEEHYTGLAELQRDKFAKVSLRAGDRLFMELCRMLDRRSVPEIIRRHRGKPSQRISLNFSLAAFSGAFFTRYIKESLEYERQNLILEINRSDLLHHPRDTGKAIKAMREAGFGVAIDGITLELLSLVNLHRIDCDFIKIAVAPTTMWLLKDGDCVAALKKLPREKIILCHCEKDSILAVGQAFHLNKYQGWAIDKLAADQGAAGESALK